MTLYEALQDIGKGRFVDNGCDYELIAIAKGLYTFTVSTHTAPYEQVIKIRLDGKQGENAREIEMQFSMKVERHCSNRITKAEYKRA